jgi:hypothetical protein
VRIALGFPFYGDDPLRKRLYEHVRKRLESMYPWTTIIESGGSTRGGCRNNIAIRGKDYDVLVWCDADSFPEGPALENAIRGAYEHGGLHLAYDMYRTLTGPGTERVLEGRPWAEWCTYVHASALGGWGGCFAMRPSDWLGVGGSPELVGWGFEDVMFGVQTETLIRPKAYHMGELTCLYHPTECSVGSPDYERNLSLCKSVEAVAGSPLPLIQLVRSRPDVWPLGGKI